MKARHSLERSTTSAGFPPQRLYPIDSLFTTFPDQNSLPLAKVVTTNFGGLPKRSVSQKETGKDWPRGRKMFAQNRSTKFEARRGRRTCYLFLISRTFDERKRNLKRFGLKKYFQKSIHDLGLA